MQKNEHGYGVSDNSYKAAGELDGIRKLVNSFYDYVESLPEARKIRGMHPEDLSVSREKLSYFLCGWLGGPRLYNQYYGPINIPGIHSHLKIGEEDRDAWLLCMAKAVSEQPYADSFKTYLLGQLYVPAERIRIVCENITLHAT